MPYFSMFGNNTDKFGNKTDKFSNRAAKIPEDNMQVCQRSSLTVLKFTQMLAVSKGTNLLCRTELPHFQCPAFLPFFISYIRLSIVLRKTSGLLSGVITAIPYENSKLNLFSPDSFISSSSFAISATAVNMRSQQNMT